MIFLGKTLVDLDRPALLTTENYSRSQVWAKQKCLYEQNTSSVFNPVETFSFMPKILSGRELKCILDCRKYYLWGRSFAFIWQVSKALRGIDIVTLLAEWQQVMNKEKSQIKGDFLHTKQKQNIHSLLFFLLFFFANHMVIF